jgi:hypothetical protein
MTNRLTVHDPRGYPPKVEGKQLAPRVQSLDGRTVFLIDCLFDNSDVFMDQLQRWFARHLPTVRIRNIKPADSWTDDPVMRDAVVKEGDAAILGVGL